MLLLLLLASCSGGGGQEKEQGRLLAKVNNKTLYLTELDGMFPEGTTGGDSLVIIQAYVDRWVREALLLNEAEQNIPSDLNIDKLVRDYRASLIRHNYEKALVEQNLDSVVTQEQLMAFYEANKGQYQLETPIMRCHFIKVPADEADLDKLRRLWNSDDEGALEELIEYCTAHADTYVLEDSTWYKVEDIAMEMPKGTLTPDNVSAKQEFSQRDNEYQYYLRVFEVKNRKDIAPLGYIEDQARKVILRSRREKLLEETIDAMYQRELRRNNIQTYY
ncbi:MAG: peptidyl-prolyl cis-trans isomerase [Phaeodactylibacter sp.]|nr:peptidyl-prolyl cis-trans isomerase [Phaeodactylibacter sp.]